MQKRAAIYLPPIGSLLRHAGRPLLELTLIPLALFWVLFTQAGFSAGVWAALGWSIAAIASKIARRKPVPAVLVISATLLAARTLIGLWTGSAFLYFLQPTLGNFLLALAMLVTLGFRRPLLAKLADDFRPFPDTVTGHPGIQRFFRQASLLWAIVFLVNGVSTLAVLATQTVGDFLIVSTAGSYSVVVLGIGLSAWWFRRALNGTGFRLRIGTPPVAPVLI